MIEKIALYPHHLSRLMEISNRIYKVVGKLSCEGALSKEPIRKEDLDKATFVPVRKGAVWGEKFDCAWFKFNGKVPENCAGKHVVALINISGEGAVYIDDKITQGITRVLDTVDIVQALKGKQVVELFAKAEGGEEVNLLVDCGFNKGRKAKLVRKDIAICNDDALKYYYDYLTLTMLLLTYGKNEHLTKERCKEINKALNSSYLLSLKNVKDAHEVLAATLAAPMTDKCTEYTAIGHAHIDLAWLWPIRETKRKGVRTFANALYNIEKYPGYKFGASQAQLFQWVKEEAPELYDRFKKQIAKGNVEVQGGMWTENDCNIPCGESLIRQFLYGEKFFKDEFGKHCKVVWLPDVFGYPASLPQIIKKCGREYFMTIKLTWNMQNKFPYKTFIWKGIDGSEVLSHMAPQGTYNSSASPVAIVKSDEGNPHKDQIDKALIVYGIGDGGGGPGEAHIEFTEREKSCKGLDKVVRRFAVEFFEDIDKESRDVIPVYDGELYLEKHQGTYTSQARNKKYNRLMERELHNVEWLCAVAKANGKKYDYGKLEDIWKEVLLYQFHDIIPGSSIKRVYDESLERYAVLYSQVTKMRDELIALLSKDKKLCAVNPAGFDRKEYVKKGDEWYEAEVKAYSVAPLKKAEVKGKLTAEDNVLENNVIKVTFAPDGSISSLVDKKCNKELCNGYLNKLTVYSDPRMFYNAWDININYPKMKKRYFKLLSVNSYVDGVQAVRESLYKYGKSLLKQKVILTQGDKLVNFETEVEWRESYKMLRADFAPTVYGDTVNCDIQFGNVDRSTLDDTPVRRAQFEICAHKFVNVDKDGYGVAVINDCKYGHRVKEGIISLNLLRSPKYPDPECDMCRHTFAYAFYPHEGSWQDSDVVKRGYCYNNPLIIGESGESNSIIQVNGDVIVETVKVSENGKGIVVRLVERYGKDAKVLLAPQFGCKEAFETDMLEGNGVKLDKLSLKFTAYEVKTIYFEM